MPELNVATLAETLPENPLSFAEQAGDAYTSGQDWKSVLVDPLAAELLSTSFVSHLMRVRAIHEIGSSLIKIPGVRNLRGMRTKLLYLAGPAAVRGFEDRCISRLQETITFRHTMGIPSQGAGARFIARDILGGAGFLDEVVSSSVGKEAVVVTDEDRVLRIARRWLENPTRITLLLLASHLATNVENSVLARLFTEKYGGLQFSSLKSRANSLASGKKAALQRQILKSSRELMKGVTFTHEQEAAFLVLYLLLNDDIIIAGALEQLVGLEGLVQ